MASASAAVANPNAVQLILSKAEKNLIRVATRDQGVPGFDEVEIPQPRGPTVCFRGRMLADTQWTTRGTDPLLISLELWETEAGALVAAAFSEPAGREDGFEDCRVLVVDPTADIQAAHFAVMEHFQWADRARSMVRELGWDLRQEVA
ncbi:hypothetical protein SZ64_04295 [Erythrobacter sp. SG61-1L]|nr:hypothetical protein SZ64_04295 [Erythrobacter sp. SG61-1L]